MRKLLIPLAGAAMLCACASQGGAPAPEHLPPNYRAVLAAKVREIFIDPYSIRDPVISAPFAGASMVGPVAMICIRANSKNRLGGYTGAKVTAFRFRNGEIQGYSEEYPEITCGGAVYEPFPEIEGDASPGSAAKGKR